MRELEVLSTSQKRISASQSDDTIALVFSVHDATFILDLGLEEAHELEAAIAQLLEARRREVVGVAR